MVKIEKVEKGLIGIGMPAFLLITGLALAFSMISFLNFGLWSQIIGWILAVAGGLGLGMALPKVMGMFK